MTGVATPTTSSKCGSLKLNMDPHTCRLRKGFGKAVQSLLRLKEDALVSIGLPCSTFVWLNRGTSRRSAKYPWGAEWKPQIRQANVQLG